MRRSGIHKVGPSYPYRISPCVRASQPSNPLTGQYEKALEAYKRSVARNPDYLLSHINLTILYSELDRNAEAQAEAKEVLRITPNFSLEVLRQTSPVKDPAEVERFLAALRKAGLA